MQNNCETSSTGYVENIHKKLRVIEMKCGNTELLPSASSGGAQKELRNAHPATMRVQVQNNSQHLHKLSLASALPV